MGAILALWFAAWPAAVSPGPSPLEARIAQWPAWTLPAPLTRPGRSDLAYPPWFEGAWQASDEDGSQYQVRFLRDGKGEVLGDRGSVVVYNAAFEKMILTQAAEYRPRHRTRSGLLARHLLRHLLAAALLLLVLDPRINKKQLPPEKHQRGQRDGKKKIFLTVVLLHVAQAATRRNRRRIEPAAVIADLHHQSRVALPQAHRHPPRAAVLDGIGQGFLGRAIQGEVLARVERPRQAGDSSRAHDARGLHLHGQIINCVWQGSAAKRGFTQGRNRLAHSLEPFLRQQLGLVQRLPGSIRVLVHDG